MKFEPSEYLILTEDKWFTYLTLEDVWEYFITNENVEYKGTSIVFLTSDYDDNGYTIIRAVNTIDRLKNYVERLLWGE
jgi:cAMP phosphodiesterase